ncbi:MAG: hypothetical protein JNM00_15460 [Flavobacteriales bacterium]|nr:hypothetical protein [Flavobacteriales bacterium]
MKTLYALACACLLPAVMLSQAPTLTIVTEEVMISEPALGTIQSNTGGAPHCIRVYASFPENFELQLLFGSSITPMNLDATGIFYQHPEGGPTTLDINTGLFGLLPELAYDSWLTIGYTDNSANTLTVIPLDQGFFNDWESGSNLAINDLLGGSVVMATPSILFPPNTPDENGLVLIAQLTGTGDFSGCINTQLRRLNPDGTVYDPPGPEVAEAYEYNNVCFTHTFSPEEACTGDFDFNGVIATSDMLLLMADFGCMSGCDKDLTGDDTVVTSDLLVLLGVFGTECPGE